MSSDNIVPFRKGTSARTGTVPLGQVVLEGVLDTPPALAHLADADRALAAYLGGEDTGEAEDVPREELMRRARSGQVVVLDVRPRHEYVSGHIPGAVSVPVEELEQRLAELPADVQVVAYCRGAYCVLAYDAVRLLTRHGRSARRLPQGMLEWRLAGMPVQSGVA